MLVFKSRGKIHGETQGSRVCLDETNGQWKMRRFESFDPNNKHRNLVIVGANPAEKIRDGGMGHEIFFSQRRVYGKNSQSNVF